MTREASFDFVIVGSGGGSVPAALALKAQGKRPLILEKQSAFGGTSAFSGGVIWIPNNHHLNEAGGNDSHDRSRTYLDNLIGDVGPASSAERRDAYIREGAEMVQFLESHGMKFLHAKWPDYYADRPGGIDQGRSLCAPLFNINELGEWRKRLAFHPLTSGLPVVSRDSVYMPMIKRTWRGKWVALKAAVRLLQNKLLGMNLRGAGNALQGRLLQIALRENIPIWTDTRVIDFMVENDRVTGVVAEQDGEKTTIHASHGVLINAGGFARNPEMRKQYLPQPTSSDWSAANPGDTGEMMQRAIALGAATDLTDEAVWLASSFLPNGEFVCFHSPNDIGKPHCIVVDSNGRRFANESCSYMEFGQRMYAAGAIPAWAIFDSNHRKNYTWGPMLPGVTPKAILENGYMHQASSLHELAQHCGIDQDGLATEIERFNAFARTGVDEDLGRGTSAYHRYYSDPKVKPNPNLGTIEAPPYYAVALYPGDGGTFGGLLTDENARVLRQDGTPIEGLYATGISTASVMGRRYPGAGSSVGPSMVFGYIAGKHAALKSDMQKP